MSSILTNNGAMVALQTLKSVNKNLQGVQSQISTGKKVANAKDNAAVWAISKVMESDVKGFKAISESLSLGQSTVAVARSATESITDLLTNMKKKIVAAQQGNVDRTKLQTDVVAMRDQIESIVSAAQFNGLNLVDGSVTNTTVLSSLNRSSSGVDSESITVNAQNMTNGNYVGKVAFGGTGVPAAGDAFGTSLADTAAFTLTIEDPTYAAGDTISLTLGDTQVNYKVSAADVASATTADVIAVGLKAAIEEKFGNDPASADWTVGYNSGNSGEMVITNRTGNTASLAGQFTNAGAGGMAGLATLDVSTAADAATALGRIEGLINNAINAAASFGSAAGRIEIQADFISKLSDSMTSGIGSLVDADMEEASARLQALQTQQQLGVQALSIANQAPQSIMQLFR